MSGAVVVGVAKPSTFVTMTSIPPRLTAWQTQDTSEAL
jgi:hypothetical protein